MPARSRLLFTRRSMSRRCASWPGPGQVIPHDRTTTAAARRAGRVPEPAPGAGVPACQRRPAARAVRWLPRSPQPAHRHRRARAPLARYAECRRQAHPFPASPALFLSTAGTRLLHSNISLTFAGLAGRAGLIRRSASCRPRVHDLRHSFAVATVLGWYRDGADIPALMPRLSTYLGHTDPQHTFWYLSAAPELMALAGHRLEAHLAGEM